MAVDTSTGSQLVTLQTVDGPKHFPKLSPVDLRGLANKLQAKKREATKRNIEECELSGEKAFEILNLLDQREPRRSEIIVWSMTPEGGIESALASIRHVDPQATEETIHKFGVTHKDFDTFLNGIHHVKTEAAPPNGQTPPASGEPKSTSPSTETSTETAKT